MKPRRPKDGQCRSRTKVEKGLSKLSNEYENIWKELSWIQRIYWIGLTGKEQERYIWIGFGRFLAILLYASAASHLVQPDSWLDPRFPRLAAWSATVLDMHPDANCSSNPEDRIVRVNDYLVVVSRETPTGYKFFRADCALIAQKPFPRNDQKE
jgi:hypothetical protein